MLYPNIALAEWLKKHPALEIAEDACEKCGRSISTTIPFIENDWIGLTAPTCDCGERAEFVVQIPRSEQAKTLFHQVQLNLTLCCGGVEGHASDEGSHNCLTSAYRSEGKEPNTR